MVLSAVCRGGSSCVDTQLPDHSNPTPHHPARLCSLKSPNVLLTADGRAKVCSWGLWQCCLSLFTPRVERAGEPNPFPILGKGWEF